MQTTVYQCDICKNSKSQNDLCHMSVDTDGIKIKQQGYFSKLKIDLCKDCLENKRFIVNPKPELSNEEIEKRNSNALENKIVEILEDLGVQFYE